MKKIAIVTVDFNGHRDTKDLLNSYRRLRKNPSFDCRWIVIDNGSRTPLLDTLRESPDVEVIQTGKNLGFTGGNNIGIRYAYHWGADYFLLINNDTVFGDPDLISKLVKAAKNFPQAGLISPKIYFAKGYEFYKNRYSASELGKVIWYAGGSFDWQNVTSVHRGIDEVDTGRYSTTEPTNFTTGCCVLIPRRVIDQVGIFDDKYFAYFEDNDYQYRVVRAGFTQIYDGTTYIYHKVSQTSQVGSDFSDYLLTKNRLFFGMRYASDRTKFALLRQAMGFLVTGRPKQKLAVVDWLKQKHGPLVTPAYNEKSKFSKQVSIVTINYKTADLTLALMKSIFQPGSGFNSREWEVILVDNGSEDGCPEKVAKNYPQVKVISLARNVGFPKGNNLGMEYSKGKYVLLLNSDIEVSPNSLKRLFEQAQNYNSGAVVVGKLQFPTGQFQDSCFDLPTPTGAFKEYFLRQSGSYFMYRPPDGPNSRVEGAVMACFLIPRKILVNVGYLWEKAFTYFEDVEYCRRLKQNHVPIYYCPDALFIHHHGATSKKIGQDRAFAMLRQASKAYHGPMKYALLTLILWVGQKLRIASTPQSSWAKS